ncbi:hypothetical protein [Halobacterium hubeiense]|nr:hypothetical protein [Halobacterium hubeiense]
MPSDGEHDLSGPDCSNCGSPHAGAIVDGKVLCGNCARELEGAQ